MRSGAKYYLAAYNVIALIFWLLFAVNFALNAFNLTTTGLLFLNIAQGLALLEIGHAAFKLVKSPVVSTAVQVASRIFVLVLINIFFGNHTLTGLAYKGLLIIWVAWSVTELIRYSYYGLGLFGEPPALLTWMRYSFFIVLYPLGVTGEALIFLSPLTTGGLGLNAYTIFIAVISIAYIYYFPKLYKYMWKQRRAKLAE